jgi:uncharacterized protein
MNAARASLVALLMCWAFVALAQIAVPPLAGRVVDQTGTLSSSDIDALTQKLRDFEARKGSQIAVLIVPTTAPEEIEQYSIRVAEAWKIGRKKVDDGAILLVAKNDHKLRIEVGYGLEGALTDVTSQRIVDEIITPKFRNGDFAGGISAGVDRIIGVIDGEPLPAPKRQQDYGSSSNIEGLFPFLIFGIFIAGGILRSVFGRLIGSVATGGVAGVLVWLFVGSIIASGIVAIISFVFTLIGVSFASNGRGGSWSGGGYSGGGSYSGGSSSSSDSGSFSGGGGSFGGGGASGSW